MADQLLNVMIADDDRGCRQRTKSLLAAERGVRVVAECTNAHEIIEAIRIRRPDLLLLEPKLPGGNPLELLASRPAEATPVLIITTAQDQYAIRAFEVRAFDYLMKPFDAERFHAAIERARIEVKKSSSDSLMPPLIDAILHAKSIPEERLVVKSAGRIVFLDFDEIDWIEAAANYVAIHAGNQVCRLREPIGQIEKRVAHHSFARIHRSVIVNVVKIREVYPCNSGEYIVRLKTGKELACSRSYSAAIRGLLSRGENSKGGLTDGSRDADRL